MVYPFWGIETKKFLYLSLQYHFNMTLDPPPSATLTLKDDNTKVFDKEKLVKKVLILRIFHPKVSWRRAQCVETDYSKSSVKNISQTFYNEGLSMNHMVPKLTECFPKFKGAISWCLQNFLENVSILLRSLHCK